MKNTELTRIALNSATQIYSWMNEGSGAITMFNPSGDKVKLTSVDSAKFLIEVEAAQNQTAKAAICADYFNAYHLLV